MNSFKQKICNWFSGNKRFHCPFLKIPACRTGLHRHFLSDHDYQDSTEKLTFGARAGLGDRLFALASGLRLSKLIDRQPVLWWMNADHCAAEFSDLFEPYENLEVINTDLSENPPLNTEIYRAKENLKLISLDKELGRGYLIDDKNFVKNKIILDCPRIVFLASEEKQLRCDKNYRKRVSEEISGYIRRLRPLKELREKIDSFAKDNFNENTVSVHLRRTDFYFVYRKAMASDEEVVKMMKLYLRGHPDVNFFLATDSEETKQKIKSELKDKITVYPKIYWVHKMNKNENWANAGLYRSADSIKEGIIELYLLSKNKRFMKFDELSSGFTIVASRLNPAQRSLTMINGVVKEA